MKIGLFTDSYHPKINGVITSVDSLKFGLEQLGHQVYIITGGQTKYPMKQNNILYLPSIDVPKWNLRVINPYISSNINAVRSLNLDIIHSHSELTIGLLANKVAKDYGIYKCHTAHTFYHDYRHYDFNNFLHLGDMTEKFMVENFCNSNCDDLIVPSEKMYSYLMKDFSIQKEPYIIKTGIYMPCSQKNQITREKLGLSEQDFILLYSGRLEKEKNIDFLIQCQKELNKIDLNIKLLLVGDGTYTNYLQMVSTNSKEIIMLGKLPYDQMAYCYQLADLTVTASTSETQGLSILESLYNKIPVLCINDSAFDYIVRDNYNGYLIKDKMDYINRALELKIDSTKMNQLRENCKKDKREYSSVQYAEEVEKVYQKKINFLK